MNFKPITLKTIAKDLSLSISTVSKALRGSHEISSDTQQLVQEYARQYKYRPNPIAQSLKKGRSNTLGVVVSNIDNNFLSQVINGIESVAQDRNYSVIITQSKESVTREIQHIENLSSRSIDGFIISVSSETSDSSIFRTLSENGFPIVFVDRTMNDIVAHKVIANNFAGAYQATQYLIECGYRRIAHLTSSEHLSITRERFSGYETALLEAGIIVDPALVKYCGHGGMFKEEIENSIDELFALQNKPDALLTASDRLSNSAIGILRNKGLEIPNDVALIGFTNSVNADIFNPSLSSVVQPAMEMGKKATELLIAQIESKRPVCEFEQIIMDTQLILRDSSQRNI
ncbi:MAG: LacI family DNA-binding transcriptional regulator [Flavitalea sp.]